MPYRSREVVERWVDEFRAIGHPGAESLRILDHSTDSGEASGLVALVVDGAGTVTSIAPSDQRDGRWMVTYESREATVALTATEATRLAQTVTMVAALCVFLEAKSLAYLDSLLSRRADER